MISWFNGKLQALTDVTIAADDRGFLLGDGMFETMAANDGHVVHLDHHMKRLQRSCGLLKIDLPYSDDILRTALEDVLAANDLRQGRAALRLTVSRGSAPRGLALPIDPHPNILITAGPAPADFPALNLKTVSVRRNEYSSVSQIKSLCYLDNILALEEARQSGGDDALILNTKGHVAETTVCNIFFIHNDQVFTPRPADGCLNGIMRQMVIKACHVLDVTIEEKSLSDDIITSCDGAFVTNSLARIRTIRSIDGRVLSKNPLEDQLLATLLEFEKSNSQ